MGRRHTTLVIDEDVIELAKAKGINMSRFFENALRNKLGITLGTDVRRFRIEKEIEIKSRETDALKDELNNIEKIKNKKVEEIATREQEEQKKTEKKEQLEELIHQRRMELVERSADLLQPIYDDPTKLEDYDWVIKNIVDKANKGRAHKERIGYADIRGYIKNGKG